MKKSRPKFIVLEGGEGSGKSSLRIALEEELRNLIVTTREPGGSPFAELIRDTALKNPLAKGAPPATMICLMFAARFDNTYNTILPALEKGTHVIADRFDASSYAYNVWGQSEGKLEDVFWIMRKHLPVLPDLYVYIDVDVREGLRRGRARTQSLLQDNTYFDDHEIKFHEDLRKGYKKFFDTVPHVIIDANRPFEEVKKDFIETMKRELGLTQPAEKNLKTRAIKGKSQKTKSKISVHKRLTTCA